jgi:enoyl-CoA hydratase
MNDSRASDVLCRIIGQAGVITLNRPQALNALNLNMIRRIRIALDMWEDDPRVACVMIEGAGGKAFCAGGDIRAMRENVLSGRFEQALTFWREEYQLNSRIYHYTKPYITLLDGIVMGGGAGLSLHGRYRVASEKFLFAMPETGIGFFPDVGMSHLLARLLGALGEWLALTGERLKIHDACMLNLVTHKTTSEAIATLRERLCAGEPIETMLAALAVNHFHHDNAPVTAHLNTINHCFAAPYVSDILDQLDHYATTSTQANQWATQTAAHMRTRCPLSLVVALEQVRRARHLSLDDVLMMDYRLASRMGQEPDFHEGVRAVVVDKDHTPRWRYTLKTLEYENRITDFFDVMSV